MPSDWEAILLGSLLHDIGKFWLRAEEGLEEKKRSLCKEPRGHRSFDTCPTCPGEFGYAHAVLSHAFAQDYVPGGVGAAFASAHHKPERAGRQAKIVALADRLSAKEREPAKNSSDKSVSQLLSVFARAFDQEKSRYYPLRHLSLDESTLFPREEAAPHPRGDYQRLWGDFVREVESIKGTCQEDFEGYFNTLSFLLQKYAWCVPSAYYKTIPDVSLYDHLRTTCAIAAALYRAGPSGEELGELLKVPHDDTAEEREVRQEGEPAVGGEPIGNIWQRPFWSLVGGDVSGVQSFLYTLTSKGVARGLRGRSFYLEILTEVAALWLLGKLGLPLVNLLYVGGGHFYILSQRLDEDKLDGLKTEISLKLLQHHQGDLYLALAAVPVAAADYESFSHKWSQVTEELRRAKRRRFAELEPEEQNKEVFGPKGGGPPEETCVVCRREGAEHPINPEDPAEGNECDLCHSFKELGRDLAEAQYLFTGPSEDPPPAYGPKEAWKRLFGDLGFQVEVGARPLPGRGLLLKLNDTDFLGDGVLKLSPQPALGFCFAAQLTPRSHEDRREVADFAELAGASQGVKSLGVLRMDVDDLGLLFAKGLGKRATISRVATLSFLLRLFFEGWLNKLALPANRSAGPTPLQGHEAAHSHLGLAHRHPDPTQDHLYLIYAGGDDLFVVGSWDQIPLLAQQIQSSFAQYACENPHVHISGGMVLVPPKFPLYQAAEEAKEALDGRAKEYPGKNAIDFLGRTLCWGDFAQVRERMERLKGMMEGGAPRALLHLLMGLAEHQRQAEKRASKKRRGGAGQLHYGRWLWMGAWSLGRLAERLEEPLGKEVMALREELATPEPETVRRLQQAALAARWAELLLRQEERAP